MNVAMIGLDSMYWPTVWAEALREPSTTGPATTRRPAHRLVACCDLGVPPADVQAEIGQTPAEFAARYGIRHYQSLDEVLDREKIEAATVATRNTRMAAVAGRLIDAGIPCYIAKPVAASPADALMLAHKAQGRGVPCTGGVTTRCFDFYQAVHRMVAEGRIGKVVSMDVMHQHGGCAMFPPRTWYREPAEGGVPYWLGWYPLGTIRWLAGSPITTVSAAGCEVTHAVRGEHEVIHASGTTQNGVCWTCRIYFAAGGRWGFPMHEVEICGEKGIVRTATFNQHIEVFDEAGHRNVPVEPMPGDPVKTELLNWLDAVSRGRAWQPSISEVAHVVTACEALRRALRTGEVARV